jgi:hypothetical protein
MIAMSTERPKPLRPLLLLAGALGTILVAAVAMAVDVMGGMGDIGMSGHGWVAMALGIVFTLGLGVGLMALVFYSARHGYDDAVASEDEHDEPR